MTSCKRHRVPSEVIRPAVRPYGRFTPRLQDIDRLLEQQRVEVTCERLKDRYQPGDVGENNRAEKAQLPIGQSKREWEGAAIAA